VRDRDLMQRRLAEATAHDYEILGELGHGGMATVFLARDLSLGRKVAIKVMSPQLLSVDGMAERFLMEARIAAALSHPNIIPIHAVRRSGDVLFFVMKHIAGRSLDRILLDHGPLPIDAVRAIVTQVGTALDAAHAAGVIHRDIKPHNILIDEHGDAVVADFGIARLTERPGMTQVGQAVGTPAYMSPEQCTGDAVTGAADQYSLGIVAYELLTGRPPFTGESLMQIVWRMVHEPAAPLASVRPECPASLAAAVHRMIEQQTTARWPTMRDAIAALPPLVPGPGDPVRRLLVALANGESPPSVAPRPSVELAAAAATVVTTNQTHGAPAGISLAATEGVLTIDEVMPLVAEVRDRDERLLPEAALEWHSADPSIAEVSPDGVLRGRHIGRTRITVACGTCVAALDLLVTRAAAKALEITPWLSSLEVGDRVTLAVRSGDGDAMLPAPRLVEWRSSDPSIAEVDRVGRVHARLPGAVELTARSGNATAALLLRVRPAIISAVKLSSPELTLAVGEQVHLDAQPANSKGHPLADVPVRWDVSDPTVAAITADGTLTAVRSGRVLVAARAGGRVGTTKVLIAAERRTLAPSAR
jgi:serine/threonine-protein kinase